MNYSDRLLSCLRAAAGLDRTEAGEMPLAEYLARYPTNDRDRILRAMTRAVGLVPPSMPDELDRDCQADHDTHKYEGER